jgi:hypothetical protein
VKLQGLFTNGGKDVTEEKERARERNKRCRRQDSTVQGKQNGSRHVVVVVVVVV